MLHNFAAKIFQLFRPQNFQVTKLTAIRVSEFKNLLHLKHFPSDEECQAIYLGVKLMIKYFFTFICTHIIKFQDHATKRDWKQILLLPKYTLKVILIHVLGPTNFCFVGAKYQGRAVDPRTPEHSGFEVPTPEMFCGWILFRD